MDITGNVVIIGAGSGIGRATSIAFALEGAQNILLADIDSTAVQETAELCIAAVSANGENEPPPPPVHTVQVDVSCETSVETLANTAVQRMGRIDYCVNSAGVGIEAPREMAAASLGELSRFWNVNVQGTFNVLRSFSAAMQAQESRTVTIAAARGRKTSRAVGRGTIVVLGSCNSFVATPRIVPYTTAKHAVMGMIKTAALDNAASQIRVNAVCPSWVDTPMTDRAIEGDATLGPLIQRVVPLGRIARSEEISDAILFLCSPRASYITGCGLLVDGGSTLQLQI